MNKDDWMHALNFKTVLGALGEFPESVRKPRGMNQCIWTLDDFGFFPIHPRNSGKTWFAQNMLRDMGLLGMPVYREHSAVDERSIPAMFDGFVGSHLLDLKTGRDFNSFWNPNPDKTKRLEAYAATQWEDRTLLHAKAYSFEFDGRSIIDSYTQRYYYDTLNDEYRTPFPVDTDSIRAQLQDVRAGKVPRMYGPKALALIKAVDWKRVGRTKSGWGCSSSRVLDGVRVPDVPTTDDESMSDFFFYTTVAILLIIGYTGEGLADPTKWPELRTSLVLVVCLYVFCLLVWWFGNRSKR